MDYSIALAMFVALIAYRLMVPVLDRIAARLWGTPHSAAVSHQAIGNAGACSVGNPISR